jgi:hypothetical protein
MNNGIEAFRSQLQKELGLSIGPKDPLLALWVSQRELLEQNAAQQQKLLSEFQAALGKSQIAWSEQAKALAQQSLNAGLQAAQNSTALHGASVGDRSPDRLAESGGLGRGPHRGDLRNLRARDSLALLMLICDQSHAEFSRLAAKVLEFGFSIFSFVTKEGLPRNSHISGHDLFLFLGTNF